MRVASVGPEKQMCSNDVFESDETDERDDRDTAEGGGVRRGAKKAERGDMWRIEGRNRKYREIFAEILRSERC
jgi:hypothetical protein